MVTVRVSGEDFIVKAPPRKNVKVRRRCTCNFCGKRFLSNRTSARYCSNACKQKMYNYRNEN